MNSKIRLKQSRTFTLKPLPPFHFDGTFHKPSHFPNKLALDRWEPDKYCQTIRIAKELYGLKIENKGIGSHPKLKVTVYANKNINQKQLSNLKQELNWRFELPIDLSEFNKLAKKDKRFYPVFKKRLGMRNANQYTLYELLIIAVLLQNARVRRSQQMLDTLLAKFGTEVSFDQQKLYAIWLPEKLLAVSEKKIRNLKLGYRAKTIKKLTQNFAAQQIDEIKLRTLDKNTAKKELLKLYGVGPETARILLFEIYHHFDVFEHIAPWQQKIYSRLFYQRKSVPTQKIRQDIQRCYGQYSMLAVHYIWEDIFWRRKNERIAWLEKEIRR